MGWIGYLIGEAFASALLSFFIVRLFMLLAGAKFSAPRQILAAYLAGGLAVFFVIAVGDRGQPDPEVSRGVTYSLGLALIVILEWLWMRRRGDRTGIPTSA